MRGFEMDDKTPTPVAILYREELQEYDFGPGHPFRGDRYEIFPRFLAQKMPAEDHYRMLRAEWATGEDLLLICQRPYIEFSRNFYKMANLGLESNGRFSEFHSPDNRPHGRPGKVEEAARLIIGQEKRACELVIKGEFEKVVSLGGGLHHAMPNWGEGFCIYNDVAFAGKVLLERYGLERVLILDTDAHAGNGTAAYFYSDPRVLFIDIHQDPRTIYPGTGFIHQTGEGQGRGFTVNLPMPPGAGDRSYAWVFDEVVSPLTREFKPQIIIRNGGSDPHQADQLTNLGLSVEGFRMIGERVRDMARVCGGKTIDMIGSGYNKEILPYAWMALIAGLANFEMAIEDPLFVSPRSRDDHEFDETRRMVDELKRLLKDHWPHLGK
jgi:acetoin utilization protein AcuC